MKNTMTILALAAISLTACAQKEKPVKSSHVNQIDEVVEVVKEEKVDPNAPFFKFDTPYSFCSEMKDDELLTTNYVNFSIQKDGQVKGTVSYSATMKDQENEFNNFSGEFEGNYSHFHEGIKIVGFLELASSDSPEVIRERQVYFLLRDFTFIELLTHNQLIIRYKSCK